MAQPRLTAVVLTYNGRELLEMVLPSLAAQRYRDFATVVVDNGSSDGTLCWLHTNWPQVDVVAVPHNLGVSAALNVCVAAATSELVALFNNDLELDPDCLGEFVRAMDEHPEAGSAAAKLVDFYDRALLDGAGDVYSWSGEAQRSGQGHRDVGQYQQPRRIFGACGGAAVYRRSALAAVGGFDEQFFAIYEDVDWAFRAQLAGFSCRYVPTAVAYHMGSATLGDGASDFSLYQNWRNAIWVVMKNYPVGALILHMPALAFVQARNLAIVVRQGRGRIWLRVWRDALAGLPDVLRARRRVQRSRVRSLSELHALIRATR